MEIDVAVIGGGITGLVTAYRLEQAGLKTQIFESSGRLGGVIYSEIKDGFLLEQGPNTVLGKPDLLKLINDLGLGDKILKPTSIAKNKFIALPKSNNNQSVRIIPLPNTFLTALTTRLISSKAKFRLLLEPLSNRSNNEDESVYDFCSRHFGKEFTQNVISTFLSGIWAADIKLLSARSALPTLWLFEKQSSSVFLGILRKSPQNTKKHAKLVSFPLGLKELIDELDKRLPNINLNCQIKSIKQENDKIVLYSENNQQVVRAKKLIITASAKATAKLIIDIDQTLASKIENIPYAPLAITHVSMDASEFNSELTGFGLLINYQLGFSLLGIIFSSLIFPNRAPMDKILLTCFSKSKLNVESELQQLLRNKSFQIISQTDYPLAVPSYSVGHHQLQNAVDDFNKNGKIFLSGNWHRGLGVPDRITEAETLYKIVL